MTTDLRTFRGADAADRAGEQLPRRARPDGDDKGLGRLDERVGYRPVESLVDDGRWIGRLRQPALLRGVSSGDCRRRAAHLTISRVHSTTWAFCSANWAAFSRNVLSAASR